LQRFAAADLADVIDGVVELKSEAGPILWELIKPTLPIRESQHQRALDCIGPESINVHPDEELVFGKKEKALAYNQFADMSISKQTWPQDGMRLDARPLSQGEIVMTAWPIDRRLIPARVVSSSKKMVLELVEPRKKDERCFVMDEHCGSLLTASLPSNGSSTIKIINPIIMDSWLVASGSKAGLKLSGRFKVEDKTGGKFLILDSKTGKAYVGDYHYAPSDGPNFEVEKSRLEHLLSGKGLGAILPTYSLKPMPAE